MYIYNLRYYNLLFLRRTAKLIFFLFSHYCPIVSFITALFVFLDFCIDCQHFTRVKIRKQLGNKPCKEAVKLPNLGCFF